MKEDQTDPQDLSVSDLAGLIIKKVTEDAGTLGAVINMFVGNEEKDTPWQDAVQPEATPGDYYVPVQRDWADQFLYDIRREERRLAAERLRARMERVGFSDMYIKEMTDVVNPEDD